MQCLLATSYILHGEMLEQILSINFLVRLKLIFHQHYQEQVHNYKNQKAA